MARTASSPIGMPTETTSAPPALRIERRENCAMFSILLMAISSAHHLGGALDRAQDPHVSSAAAFEARKRVFDLSLCGSFLLIEECRGCHDPAVDAVATLRHLLLDIGLLYGMWLLRGAKAGKRNHLAVSHGRNWCDARSHQLSINVNRAGAALRQAAPEMWIIEPDVVTQSIEQRHVGISIDCMH